MIKLWDGWAIDADQYQYILGLEATDIIKGREFNYLDKASYHKTLAQALSSFMEKKKREKIAEKDMTLQLAVQYIQEMESRIQNLIYSSGLSDSLFSPPAKEKVFRTKRTPLPEGYDPYDL